MDGKTPTAETASPIAEKESSPQLKIQTKFPLPKETDFIKSEVDPYSELCSRQLDGLDDVCEETEMEVEQSKEPIKSENTKVVNVNKLQPLDLKVNEPKIAAQKLTTPGQFGFVLNELI